jgi:hypothetical protein
MTTDSGEWERTASASSMSQNYFHYALPNKKYFLRKFSLATLNERKPC